MITIAEDEVIKNNTIKLAREHRQFCDSECNISLFWLLRLLQKANIEITDEEKKEFI